MDSMNELQQYLVEDHIHGLEHEAERLRAERARDHHPVDAAPARATMPAAGFAATPPPTSAAFAVAPVTIDPVPSTRVRLGRWLVGAGATIERTEALTPSAGATSDGAAFAAIKNTDGPCDDGPSSLSHAA